jgi:uncharacterized protein (DUF924 family)
MPLQHTESRKVQAKSVELYNRLAETISATERETFLTVAQFAELHKDIVDRLGRFRHRNKLLNLKNLRKKTNASQATHPILGRVRLNL